MTKFSLRLNNPVNKTNDIKHILNIIETYLFLKEEELNEDFIEKRMQEIFRKRVWNDKRKIKEKGLPFSGKIDIKTYYFMQKQLKKITGKYWPLDRLIILLLIWFTKLYKYPLQLHYKKNLPIRRKAKKTQRYNKLISFEKKFKQYYKNIPKITLK